MADEQRTEVEQLKEREDVASDPENHNEEERLKGELDAGND